MPSGSRIDYERSRCRSFGALAERHGLVFLTGDKEFERMGNVEFVR